MTTWEKFFSNKIETLLTTSHEVVDFGGGLRLSRDKSDREDAKNAWLKPLVAKINYRILDTGPEYRPDVIGDIHNLPFADASIDAFICLAVLEHVRNPIKAMEELFRTLKPGGQVLMYVPFLFYYHNHEGNHQYGDYWRFTSDTLKMFAEPFSSFELQSIKQPIETAVSLTPLVRLRSVTRLARWLDMLFYKRSSQQVSGYYLYLVK